jgi:EmrB/QacA subfamily drug resistance transporter
MDEPGSATGRRRHTFSRLPPAAGLGACPADPDVPPGAASPGETRAVRRRQRWTLAVVCLASSLLLFNVTAPNVALPAIAEDLAARFSAQQWVLSGYALVLASLLLAGGVLGDRYGRRRVFLVGLAVYGAGSLACAFAPTTGLLIAGRLLQGVGAAAMFSNGLALIAAEFPPSARARAIGVWGASVSAAVALGPLLGGVLVEASGWRAQFVLAVVLVIPIFLVSVHHLRESRDRCATRLDWPGVGLLTTALVLLIVLIQRANSVGWLSPITLSMAVAAVLLFGAFLVIESRTASALIAPSLMRNPTFLGATIVAVVLAAAAYAPLVYLTLFLLWVAGSGPMLAGLQVAPFAVAALVVSLLAARVSGRLGMRRALVLGLALCALGLAAMQGLDSESGELRMLPGLVALGAGAGLVNPTMTVAALSTVDAAHSGMASGVNNTARQIGIAAGVAGLGAVFEARLAGGISAALASVGVPTPTAVAAGQLEAAGDTAAAAQALGTSSGALPAAYAASFSSALSLVFLLGAGVVVIGAVVVVSLIRPSRTAEVGTPVRTR